MKLNVTLMEMECRSQALTFSANNKVSLSGVRLMVRGSPGRGGSALGSGSLLNSGVCVVVYLISIMV